MAMLPNPEPRIVSAPDELPEQPTRTLSETHISEDKSSSFLDFAPDEVLDGRFRIIREIGRGGMGVVFEASDEKLSRRIALKCARARYTHYLTPEVRNASEVSHRNVCRIFEIHTAATRLGPVEFITMEFLEGETLSHRLRRGRLTRTEAVEIARQLAAGLAEAHRNGVIHGDIKTNNVILTTGSDGSLRAVITDFGLARSPETQSRRACGTPGYMAPELWKGGSTTAASDVYAMGVVLSALARGRPNSHLPSADCEAAANRMPLPVNPRWDGVLGRCLDPDPARRYQDAGELALALSPSRTRRLAVAAAVIALLLAGATGIVTWRNATAPTDTVKLAVLPFSVQGSGVPSASAIGDDIAGRLAGARRRFTVFSPSELKRQGIYLPSEARARLGATHAFQVEMHGSGSRLFLNAVLTDLSSGQQLRDLKAGYARSDAAIMSRALLGTITGAFHLNRGAPQEQISPAAYPLHIEAAEILRADNGRPEAAIALLEKAIALDPRSALLLAELAEAQIDQFLIGGGPQWLERAAENAARAKTMNPDAAPVLLASGLIEEQHGSHEAAIRDFSRAVELDPGKSDGLRLLALAFGHSNRPSEAAATYQKAIDADPANYRTWIDFGNFHYFRGDFPAAEKEYRRVIATAPNLDTGYMNLGLALEQQGRVAEAEGSLLIALKLHTSADALMNLGAVYYAEEKFQKAADSFEASVRSGIPTPFQYKNLGDALRQLGRQADAASSYRKSASLAEEEIGRNPRQAFMRVVLALVAARLGNSQRAVSEINQALVMEPENAAVVREAVIAFEVLGDRKRALQLLQDAPPQILRELNTNPDVKELRRDPRFSDLVHSRI
jgi:tetratricopeptide (TPR) repeat protein